MSPRTLLCVLLAAAALASPATADDRRLVVLHTTDLHGSLTSWDYLADRAADRGLVRIGTLVDSVRAEGAPVLLVDAGDTIEGAGIETVRHLDTPDSPDPMVAAMNALGYDAMCPGNHEFDFGRGAADRARAQAVFPWLAANVTANGRPAFGTSVVKKLGGLRVGITGVTTPATPQMTDAANVAGLAFGSPLEAARREVARLRTKERCDVVVLLAHTGLERDTAAVAAAVASGAAYAAPVPDENWGWRLAHGAGADVVILGHTHTTLAFTRGGTTCAQAGRNGEALGRVDLTLARDHGRWRVRAARATTLPVRAATPEHAAVAAIAAPVHEATRRALDRPVGRADVALAAPAGRFADNPLWQLVQRAQLDASGADVSLAAMYAPDARIEPGAVTRRDVLRLYPYDNTLGAVRLTGAQLRDVLECSAALLAPYDATSPAPALAAGAAGFNFDAAHGVTYDIDRTRPSGSRVANLQRDGRPVADGESLTVVTNSYRLGGGGGYPWLATAPRVWSTPKRAHEVIAAFTAAHAPLAAAAPAWRVVPAADDPPAPQAGAGAADAPPGSPARERIARLARGGVLTDEEAAAVAVDDARATRGDLAVAIARAFAWRPKAPRADTLAARRAAFVQRGIATAATLRPDAPLTRTTALDWCERAARAAGYRLAPSRDAGFRRGLVRGVPTTGDTLTRAAAFAMVANLRFPEIRILETTDFHGFILAGSKDRRTGRALGGSPVLAAWIAKLAADNPDGTLLLDGGDCFQGTMISNLQYGRPVVEQMNALRYTAMAIGNHEFDWTADTLEARVHGMRFSALGANMLERKTGKMPRWVRSDTVVTRHGVRIGVLGMCYRYTPSVTLAKHVTHLTFADDSATAAKVLPGLRGRSDVVIGVGHIPAETDSTRAALSGDLPRLARGVRGVAAWFGGHSHNLVCDRVAGVPVMIAGAHGECVAVCDLVVDPLRKQVIDSKFELVRTWADEVTPDSAMAARVERWNAAVAPIAATKLGTSARPLRRNRGGEAAVGDLVADAIREASGADIALQNNGGLRADLDAGDITRGSIFEVLPFDNVVFKLGLTGAEVKQALEQALRWGRVTQVSGIRYRYDGSRPVGDRVLAVTDLNGTPLDSARVYVVAVNDFMATGGDNYDVLSGGRHREQTNLLVREALEAYVSRQKTLDVSLDGRIQREGAADNE